jgi:hypothetical protein
MSIHMTRLTNYFLLLFSFRSLRYPDKFQILDCKMTQQGRNIISYGLFQYLFGSTKLIHKKPHWSRWPRGLRCGYSAASLLGLRVWFPPKVWMSVSCDCCKLSGKCHWQGPIPRPEDSYLACAKHWVWSGATITLYTYNEFAERGHIKKERKASLKITHFLNEIRTWNLPNKIYKC